MTVIRLNVVVALWPHDRARSASTRWTATTAAQTIAVIEALAFFVWIVREPLVRLSLIVEDAHFAALTSHLALGALNVSQESVYLDVLGLLNADVGFRDDLLLVVCHRVSQPCVVTEEALFEVPRRHQVVTRANALDAAVETWAKGVDNLSKVHSLSRQLLHDTLEDQLEKMTDAVVTTDLGKKHFLHDVDLGMFRFLWPVAIPAIISAFIVIILNTHVLESPLLLTHDVHIDAGDIFFVELSHV